MGFGGNLAGLFADPPAPSALSPFSNPGRGILSGLSDAASRPGRSFGVLSSFVTPPSPSPLPPPSRPLALRDLVAPPHLPYLPPAKPKPVAPEVKRKAFFSFNFEDVMRVNNVRQAWKITHPNSVDNRSFYDSSLWESRKITNEEAFKKLTRAGVLTPPQSAFWPVP